MAMPNPPLEYGQVNHHEVVLSYSPSHRGGRRFRLKPKVRRRNLMIVIHGTWPAVARTVTKNGKPVQEIKHIYSTKECHLNREYDRPTKNLRCRMHKRWPCLWKSRKDEHLWREQWWKHGQYHILNGKDFWETTLDVAKPFRSIMTTLARSGFVPGNTYNCKNFAQLLSEEIGHIVRVSFGQKNGVTYLNEIGFLFDREMDRMVNNNQPDLGDTDTFIFEDWRVSEQYGQQGRPRAQPRAQA